MICRLIRFTNKQLNINDNVAIEYQYYKTNTESELLFGTNSPGPYKLKHTNILKNTLSIKLGQTEAKEFIDYLYKEDTNSIYFYYTIHTNKPILINYKYKELEEKKSEEKDTPFSISVTYLDETTSVRKNLSTFKENQPPNHVEGNANNVIVLQDNPIDMEKPIKVVINGREYWMNLNIPR